jgi:hypothetical protein
VGARDEVHLELDGVRIAMLHDAGPRARRAERMARLFPDADVVIFGHSHEPLIEHTDGLLLLNPGSAADRRRQPFHTMAVLRLDNGDADAEIVRLD